MAPCVQLLVDRLTEEFHQVGGFRRCVAAVKSVLSDPHLDGSRQTGTHARTGCKSIPSDTRLWFFLLSL